MKIRFNLFYAALLGVAVAIPMVGHSVTLSSANRTPCLFGALGTPTACSAARDAAELGAMARSETKALTPQATTIGETDTQSALVSTIVAPEEQAIEVENPASVASVPLPMAGGLLFGSLGLMIFAVRKSRRA